MTDPQRHYLPSMSDLLASPTLKGMANYLNPATVFNTARSVLEEVAAEAKNVASERRMPDISELTERTVTKLKTVQIYPSLPLVNMTGILFPFEIAFSELPVKAIDRLVASFGDGFFVRQSEIQEMICKLTGAADAVVVSGHAAALMLVFDTLTRSGRSDVLTTPGDLYETMTGYRIKDVFTQASCDLNMVGSIIRATLDDYAAGITDETAFVYCANGIDGCLAVKRHLPDLSQLADFTRKQNISLIYDAEWCTFHATDDYGLKGIPTCRDLIKQGVSLLVFSCGGLNGCDFATYCPSRPQELGENGGQNERQYTKFHNRCFPVVVAGEKTLIREIRKSPLFPMFMPSWHDMAALEAVLSLSLTQDSAENELPIWQLLSTDIVNLKLRADRMAIQIAAIPGITDASVVSAPALLTPLRPRYTMPSLEIHVTFATKTAVEMLAVLASCHTEQSHIGIAAATVPDQPNTIALNLRTMFAKYDMLVIDMLITLITSKAVCGKGGTP